VIRTTVLHRVRGRWFVTVKSRINALIESNLAQILVAVAINQSRRFFTEVPVVDGWSGAGFPANSS